MENLTTVLPTPEQPQETAALAALEADLMAHTPEVQGQIEAQSKRLGKSALKGAGIRLGMEGVGALVDGALIATGLPMSIRETIATAPEILVYDKLMHNSHEASVEGHSTSRLRKFGRTLSNTALGIGVAMAAQKIGVGVASDLVPGMSHNMHEYVVPITSKLGAMTSLSAARNRIGRR